MPINWKNKTFYHLYPLGFCNALDRREELNKSDKPLHAIEEWGNHLESLGIDVLFLGPVFYSSYHGYDTIDWYKIDPRLGTNDEFAQLCKVIRSKGIQIILDGVFHHVGKDFWAFQDLLEFGESSQYVDWFSGIQFDRREPTGEPFSYDCWEGHTSLVKLNLNNAQLREHIFGAVKFWIEYFDISGIRFDVAYALDTNFLNDIRKFAREIKDDFYFLHEVIHGDYRNFIGNENSESVTNYECFKGIYSAHNDRNLFEIAHSLERQFGANGIYQGLTLYNFLDNHDVNRIASLVNRQEWVHTAYILLFTMPGVPSVYYGSEWGIHGKRDQWSDRNLRPSREEILQLSLDRNVQNTISKLINIRKKYTALQSGDFHTIHLESDVFGFLRRDHSDKFLIIVNIDSKERTLSLELNDVSRLEDLLNEGESFHLVDQQVHLKLYPSWGRILKLL